jgi:hypothetical protein
MSPRDGRLAFRDCAAICVIAMVVSAGLSSAHAQTKLQKLSTDTFTNSYSEHRTEVEPHTYAHGSTIVSAFQVKTLLVRITVEVLVVEHNVEK